MVTKLTFLKKARYVIYQFYKDIMESNKQILGTVLFCNRILTFTDSFEEQLAKFFE